jgi:hypothetical protein
MNLNRLLVAALVIQSAMIIGLWFGPSAQTARADVPFANQEAQMIQLLTDSNSKLDKLISILDGGHLQVHVVKADDAN